MLSNMASNMPRHFLRQHSLNPFTIQAMEQFRLSSDTKVLNSRYKSHEED